MEFELQKIEVRVKERWIESEGNSGVKVNEWWSENERKVVRVKEEWFDGEGI